MNSRLRSGFTLIELLVVVFVIGVIAALLLPAVQSAREAARNAQCRNNLKQIGLAAANYQAALNVFPFGVGGSGPPNFVARWSAQSQLLLYLEQPALYHSINFSFVPWGHDPLMSPPNTTALSTSLSGFLCPSDSDQIIEEYNLTHNNYRACAGTLPINLLSSWPSGTGVNSGVFWYQSAVGPARMADGMSTTALFSERCLGNSSSSDLPADYYLVSGKIDSCESIGPTTPRFTEGVEWSGERWADGNIFYTRYHHIFSPNKPSCNFSTDDYTGSAVVTATSRHPGGVNLLNADGSARFVKETIAPAVWRAFGTISGREVVNNAAF